MGRISMWGFGQCQLAMSLRVFAFLRESVKYTQDTMEEALKRVKSMDADLGGTEILAPLKAIYSRASIPGHPLQVRIGTELTERGWRERNLGSRMHRPEFHYRVVATWCAFQSCLSCGKGEKTRGIP